MVIDERFDIGGCGFAVVGYLLVGDARQKQSEG